MDLDDVWEFLCEIGVYFFYEIGYMLVVYGVIVEGKLILFLFCFVKWDKLKGIYFLKWYILWNF